MGELKDALAHGNPAIRIVNKQPDLQAIKERGESLAFLLYLNKETWIKDSHVLEADVRNTHNFAHGMAASLVRMGSNLVHHVVAQPAHTKPIDLVLVHENETSKGGCSVRSPLALWRCFRRLLT